VQRTENSIMHKSLELEPLSSPSTYPNMDGQRERERPKQSKRYESNER